MKFLEQLANPNYANHLALITEKQKLSYQELDQLSNACANLFLQNEISSNSVVLLCFQNQSLQFIASIAALKAGACQIAMQSGGSADKKQHLATQAQVQCLITDFDLQLDYNTLQIDFSILRSSPQNSQTTEADYPQPDPGGLAIIVPGSGTTGTVKLIGIDYPNLDRLIARDLIARPIQETERHLSFTPVEFYTAKRRNFATLQVGGCVIMREYVTADLYQLMAKYSIEHLSIATPHAHAFLKSNPEITKKLFSNTKTMFLGGSPVSEKLRTQLRENITQNLYIAYGTNEIGECCIASPELQKRFENCVGTALGSIEVEIVDDEGNLLANNTTGHLRIKPDAMYSCYINNNDDKTPSTWFYPGDYALLNEDGVLILKGRSDDAIIHDGVIIYPREIEQHLEMINEIEEVAAFAIDVADNQIPAVVFTASRPLNIKNIEKYLRSKMGWLAPKYIRQRHQMPKNAGGKILKRKIKQSVMDQLAKQQPNNAE